jgi:hypothetical protein
MNKLVIIGNGFDLAHGLKTSYKDFIKWFWEKENAKLKDESKWKRYEEADDYLYSDIVTSERVYDCFVFEDEYIRLVNKIVYKDDLHLFPQFSNKIKDKFLRQIYKSNFNKWLDIEKEYFNALKRIVDRDVENLNITVDAIKEKLSYYLSHELKRINKNRSITNHFNQILNTDESELSSLMVLNFNYTNTVEKYVGKRQVNYIHGKLNDKNNPIIFGYGDETDENYEKIEKIDDNKYLKHMKSFAYLQTPNYRKLFDFLDTGFFEVHIMGHSCGVSDRLLFKHILEHDRLHSVKIYYYEYLNKEKNVIENDFFEKTQNLSRYFDMDSKHKMRTKVVPFNESKPLTPYKPQN